MLSFDSSSSLGELALKAEDFPPMDEVSSQEPVPSTPSDDSVPGMDACCSVCEPCSLQQQLPRCGMAAESHTSPVLRSTILEDGTPIQDRSSESKSAMSADVIVERQEPKHILNHHSEADLRTRQLGESDRPSDAVIPLIAIAG